MQWAPTEKDERTWVEHSKPRTIRAEDKRNDEQQALKLTEPL